MDTKTVIVTGAASGMGRAEAEHFARQGARVAVVDLDGPGAEEVARLIRAEGGQAVGIKANLTTSADIEALVHTTIEEFGPVDVLVNNAGIFDYYKASLDTDRELWDRQFAINVTSVFEMSNAVLPGMIERGSGCIVNVSSLAGMVAGKGGAAYTASKHAVIGYTRHLAAEYGPHGVRTNAILPGTIETALTSGILADIPKEPIPLRRFGTAEEVATLVSYLASDGAGFINGACVTIDGGYTVL